VTGKVVAEQPPLHRAKHQEFVGMPDKQQRTFAIALMIASCDFYGGKGVTTQCQYCRSY
jgi:hypothetical protein